MVRKAEQIPECSSISQLQTLNGKENIFNDDDLLFIVSEKCSDTMDQTETGYISRSLRYDDLMAASYRSLSIDAFEQRIKVLSISLNEWNIFKERYLTVFGTASCNIDEPYILSAVQLSHGMIVGLSGYFLSSGIETILNKYKFPQISAETGYFNDISANHGRFDDLYIDGKHLTYEDLIKDQFLNGVEVVSNKMVFNFKLANGDPNTISTDLSDFAGQIGYRNWIDGD